jgi:DNA replication protein DnaC
MLAKIKNTFGNGESTEAVMEVYLNAHLLVLDDFVTVRPTDWVIETLYHLINYRYEHMKKTVITCNFSLEKLEEMLQEQRITSRISRSYTVIKRQSYI